MKGLILIIFYVVALPAVSAAQSNQNDNPQMTPTSQSDSVVIPHVDLSPLPIRRLKMIALMFVTDSWEDDKRRLQQAKNTADIIAELTNVLGLEVADGGTIMMKEVIIKPTH